MVVCTEEKSEEVNIKNILAIVFDLRALFFPKAAGKALMSLTTSSRDVEDGFHDIILKTAPEFPVPRISFISQTRLVFTPNAEGMQGVFTPYTGIPALSLSCVSYYIDIRQYRCF